MDKTELRQAAIRARAKLSGCEREAASRAICELLWAMPEVQGARVIFSYLAIAISAIGIFNNIVICFHQRRKEFAVMASVGMNAGKRKRLILTESMLFYYVRTDSGNISAMKSSRRNSQGRALPRNLSTNCMPLKSLRVTRIVTTTLLWQYFARSE